MSFLEVIYFQEALEHLQCLPNHKIQTHMSLEPHPVPFYIIHEAVNEHKQDHNRPNSIMERHGEYSFFCFNALLWV